MRMHPELVKLEAHGATYSGNGRLSTVCFPNGSIAAVPQKAPDLLAAIVLALLETKK